MRNMAAHADRLAQAAVWFRWLYRIAIGFAALAVLSVVLNILSGRQPEPVLGLNSASVQFLNTANAIGAAISLGVGAVLFRTGFTICYFLSDFAEGLAAQQVRRERENRQ